MKTTTTIQHIKVSELLSILIKKYKLTPQQKLTITFKVEDTVSNDDDEEDDIENLGDDLIEAFKEIVEAKKKGIELPNARNLLKEL